MHFCKYHLGLEELIAFTNRRPRYYHFQTIASLLVDSKLFPNLRFLSKIASTTFFIIYDINVLLHFYIIHFSHYDSLLFYIIIKNDMFLWYIVKEIFNSNDLVWFTLFYTYNIMTCSCSGNQDSSTLKVVVTWHSYLLK